MPRSISHRAPSPRPSPAPHRRGVRRSSLSSLRPVTAGLAALALVATLAPAAGARPAADGTAPATTLAANSEFYPVPASGVWEVEGRGYGHGRGMSQWGAQGAASQGRSATEILDFYYPGTGRRNIGDPTVRVLLVAPSDARRVTFTPRAGVPAPSVRTTDGRTLQGPWLTIQPASAGSGLVAEVRQVAGGAVTASGPVLPGTSIVTDGGVLVGAGLTPRTGTWYRGEVSIRTQNGFEVVNTLPMQQYLYGVVPREAPAGWLPAALQAQAIAARTYEQAVRNPTATHDLCDTTRCQVYGGRSLVDLADGRDVHGESPSTNAAVDATLGLILTQSPTDVVPAFTQFSSSSGGWTVAGSAQHPYLVAKPDPYSGSAPGDTATRWTTSLNAATVSNQCPARGRATGLEITGRDGRGEFGGRITGLVVHCTTGTTSITREFDMRLGMKSSWWQPVGGPSMFYLSNRLGSEAEHVVEYGPRGTTDVLVGDWNGDGVTGLGYRVDNELNLRNSPTAGAPDITVPYGRPGDDVLVGDWTGRGRETVAVRRGNVFHLRYAIAPGTADKEVPYGKPDDEVLIGDWNGDGVDTPGVRRGNRFLLKNSWAGGEADITVDFGKPEDEVVIGDWTGSGSDTPAVRRGRTFYIQPTFRGGPASHEVVFGRDTDRALVGDWDGDGVDTLGLHRLGR